MSFADRNRAHDSLHHLIAIGEPLNLALVPDISCLICYPIEEEFEYPENFDDFWSWYRLQFRATQYSKETTDLFTELRTSIPEFVEQPDNLEISITVITQTSALVESCRYQPSTDLSKDNIYQIVLDLILVLARTNHIETGSSPFLEWTKSFIEQQDILLEDHLQSINVESNTSENQPSRILRSGRTYNPTAQY